ncbi:MAG: YfiR family protein [Fibrobacter sp.]|nr:YfiR family protein [Fibrobacter sp.]
MQKKVTCFIYAIFLFCGCACSQVKELPLKALFLEAAVRFITWPAGSDSLKTDSTFRVGVFPDDRIVPHLKQVFSEKKVKNRSVVFQDLDTLNEAVNCNLIVLPEMKPGKLATILSLTRGKPILTVSESPELAKKGVILCIASVNQQISCMINETEASRSNLKISHHLLKKSRVITTQEKTP